MKIRNLITRIYSSSKKAKFLTASLLALTVLSGAVVHAGWTPSRPVFDWNKPSDRVGSLTGPVFNSFINTPYYGDERAFFDAGRTDQVTRTTGFKDVLPNVTQGSKEVILRTYIHNNANQTLNDAAHNFLGVAKNTRIRITLPNGTATALRARSYITADNAKPTEVTDTAEMVDSQAFSLKYVTGSAVIYNSAHPSGLRLSDNIVTTGDKIGFNQMDGNFPGCFQFQAIVEIHVKIEVPKLSIQKQVRMPGETAWHESVNTKPGDTVQWLVKVINNGPTVQHNVVASDLLPPHVTFVPGSAKWYSASQNGVAYNFNQFIINNGNGGYIFGNYAANGGGFLVRFDTKVNGDFDPCSITIRNIAHTKSTESPTELTDTADVKITKPNCVPKQPMFSCDLLSAKSLGDNKFRFTVNASAAGGATVKFYTFDFGDGSEKLVTDKTVVDHTYARAGDYVARVSVTANVDGADQEKTSETCQVVIHVGSKPNVVPHELPATGPTDMIGVFTGTSLAGAFLHRKWSLRRFGKR